MNASKISQKMKNLFNIEKNIIEWKKVRYYKKIF